MYVQFTDLQYTVGGVEAELGPPYITRAAAARGRSFCMVGFQVVHQEGLGSTADLEDKVFHPRHPYVVRPTVHRWQSRHPHINDGLLPGVSGQQLSALGCELFVLSIC
jgi:hypothetical protein